MEPLPLKTVRPLVFETMSLGTDFTGIGDQLAADDVVERVRAKIDEMLETAKELLTGTQNQRGPVEVERKNERKKKVQHP